jgi:two-component system, chemotaxis family, CheB/CheR fusion protein
MARKTDRKNKRMPGDLPKLSTSDTSGPTVSRSTAMAADSRVPKKANSELAKQLAQTATTSEREKNRGFPIVGIGASAGGLDAFKKFFGKMPADSGAAFVVVPHLDPTHESLMVELLARQTKMPVCEARDAMSIEPNRVYVIPPNRYLTIVAGKLQLSAPVERHGSPTAIDFFFRSLAAEKNERAIGIILSGTSSHGTLGLKEIKLAGGMVMVQQPESAEYDQMPRSAIATGLVDFVLPPEEMPEALVKYVRHPYVQGPSEQTAEEVAREQLNRILAILKTKTRYDFRNYRKNMLLRRVLRRMGLCHLEQMADYIDRLRDNPDEITALHKDLLIGVTEFFRDPEAFQVLEQRVIPELIRQASDLPALAARNSGMPSIPPPVRVWIPACATGEEAYSVAMLLIERSTAEKKPADIHVFATDVDERALEIARQGIYSESSIAGISPERLRRFFSKIDANHWQVNKQLRESITFAPQNLISDAPFSKLNLISCRNLLIYLEPDVQAKVIRLFHFSLVDGGYLLLGPSESIGREVDLFEPVSKQWRVFRRIGAARRALVDIPIMATEERRRLRIAPPESPPAPAIGFKELMQRLILDDFAPASALISRNHEIVSVIGPLVNFLEFPPGEMTKDLLAMARPGLRTKLRAAVHKAIQGGEAVTDLDARVKRDGSYVSCSITVKPLVEPKDAAGLLLVTFQDRMSAEPAVRGKGDARPSEEIESPLLQHLEHELKSTREDLQSTVEEYESSTEELKASNEEVMSMNEELQSANEELETSKEELQSLNEELSTVNSQLQDKVEELDTANSDLTNLMASSEVATLFLDTQFRIKRFTPPVAKLLNFRATDLDRLFADFAPRFDDEALLEDCRAVLEKLTPIEKEVWTKSEQSKPANGPLVPEGQQGDTAITFDNLGEAVADSSRPRCYLRRILPYRTTDNRIDGVVITFTDITNRITAEVQARRLAAVLWDSNDAVTVQDFDGRITAWNRGAERMYGYPEAEALRMNIRDTVPESKRAEALAYVQSLLRNESVKKVETQRVTKDGRMLDVELTVTAYRDEHGRPIGVATTERDITERKQLALSLLQLNATLEQRVGDQTREVKLLAEAISHLGEGVLITSNHLDWPGPQILFVNEALCRITGYSASELIGQSPRLLQGSESSRQVLDHVKQELSAGRSCLVELVNHRKDGTPYDAELFITSLCNAQGLRTNFVSIHRDISERKRTEKAVRESEERLQAILKTAADAIITIDQRGIITTINPATERLFGYVQAELLGQNVHMLMPQPYRDEHDAYIARYLKSGEARIIGIGREVVGQRKDGSTFPVDLAVSAVDHLGLFTGTIRDISFRKQLQKQVLEAAVEEQRRIGQELHDGTGQELTGLSLFAGSLLDLLNEVPKRGTDEKATWLLEEADLLRLRQFADRLSQGLVEANRHVHQLCQGIMPVQIEVEGLRSALEELAAKTGAQSKIACRFDCPFPVAVANKTTATHLYRIAQEALNNALRHSRANQICISLSQVKDEIILEVSDNGIGFDPGFIDRTSVPGSIRCFGLEIMNYRAGMIGGTLRITRRDEGGMLVRCVVSRGGG